MSNSPNIKLMNRSCFDRKRFAALLHEDWAARRTVASSPSPQATCYSLSFSRCLASKYIRKTPPCYRLSQRIYWKTSSPTSQTRPPTKMLRSSPLRHSFSYSLYSLRGYGTRPYTTRDSTSGTCCSLPPRSRSSPDGGSIPFLFRFWQAFLLFWQRTSPVSSFATWPSRITASPVPSSLLPDFIQPPPALCSGCSSRPVCWAKPFPPEAKRDGPPCAAHSANAQSCCCPSF